MQTLVPAWLLHPGDPLPPLATDRGVLSPPAGQWWLLALGTTSELAESRSTDQVDELAVVAWVDAGTDTDQRVARALGVWTGSATLPCCVVVEPGGSVAGAWTGASLAEALAQAAEALRGWRHKG